MLRTHGDPKYHSSTLGRAAEWDALRVEHRQIGSGAQNCVPAECTELVYILSGVAKVRRRGDGQTQEGIARLLRMRFPGARVQWMDAARVGTAGLAEDGSVGSVVSGLPLLTMSPRQVFSILSGAFRYLRLNGGFYQFTYGPVAPIPRRILDRLGLKATLIGRTLNNLPPAAVYRVSRRAASRFSTAPARNES